MSERFKIGDRVLTVKPKEEPAGYSRSARDNNRWGVEGVVCDLSDSHGLCYQVRHGGTEGFYEPTELQALPALPEQPAIAGAVPEANDDVVVQSPDQQLAIRLRALAQYVEDADSRPLNEDTEPLVDSLLKTLELLLTQGEPFCSVLVTLGEDCTIADWLCTPGHPPEPLFEMVGRLQALCVRVGGVATHLEHHAAEVDHTGHGCEHDPVTKAKDTN